MVTSLTKYVFLVLVVVVVGPDDVPTQTMAISKVSATLRLIIAWQALVSRGPQILFDLAGVVLFIHHSTGNQPVTTTHNKTSRLSQDTVPGSFGDADLKGKSRLLRPVLGGRPSCPP